MRYLSLFSGIGGFELGIKQAYERIYNNKQVSKILKNKGRRKGHTNVAPALLHSGQNAPLCVGYSEINKYAIEIYQKHFPEHHNYGDITKIATESLSDFDILVGGFPCQSFSIAGKRRGFDDTRGTLFFDIARILKIKKPKQCLLENVKGLLSHDNGNTFKTIIATLDELGYDVQWQVLNSKDFGVPQNRERVFIVGHLRGTPRPQVFPFAENGGEDIGIQKHLANTLTARYEGAQGTGTYIGEGQLHAQIGTLRTHKSGQGFREIKEGISPTILARAREDGSGQPVIMYDLKSMGSKTRRGMVSEKGYAKTLDHNCFQGVSVGMKIRRLTPIECERLQGFPDNWTSAVSDSQRYKCCGNAATVNVIQAIMERLLAN